MSLLLLLAALALPARAQVRVEIPREFPRVTASLAAFAPVFAPSLCAPALAALPLAAPAVAAVPGALATVEAGSTARAARQQVSSVQAAVQSAVEVLSKASASPADAHEAGGRIEAVVTGGRVALGEDLPPAGAETGLDGRRIRWLYRALVDGSSPKLTRTGYRALVLGRREDTAATASYVAAEPESVRSVLAAMYDALQLVVDSDLPAEMRGRTAHALNARFSGFLDEVLRQEGLSEQTRLKVSRAKAEFLDEPVVLEELTRRRQTLSRLRALEKDIQDAQPRNEPYAGTVMVPAHEQWRIGAPVPEPEREQRSFVHERTDRLPQLARDVDALSFRFETLRKRLELASRGGFSERLREKTRAALEDFASEALDGVRTLNAKITRIAAIALPRGFMEPGAIDARLRGIVFVPNNRNLRMRVTENAALVTVDFETDIDNDDVLKTVAASIEDYWRGEFVLAGRTRNFQTRVNIRRLAPGQAFSPGSLTLREAVDTVASASKDGIVFDRDLAYSTPAHEFGHILGLNDEYTEGYRAADRTRVQRRNMGSLMGSLEGGVQSRHLRTAYQLLRRRSLEN